MLRPMATGDRPAFSHILGAEAGSMPLFPLLQAIMSSKLRTFSVAAALLVSTAVWSAPGFAQYNDDETDLVVRVQRLEERLRQITGQNEELQYRNRRLEEQLRQYQSQGAPVQGAPPVAAAPPPQSSQPLPAPPPLQTATPQDSYPGGAIPPAPAPIYREENQAAPAPSRGRRGDAFDPSQNPNAPGAPRVLGTTQPSSPVDTAAVGAPGGRGPGEPLDLGSGAGGGDLTTLPPTATPRDEFDLGIGYIQRRDYALADETMRNFVRKYPNDRLVADANYWLGESLFQRQRYRDAAEVFLDVTSKYGTSGKAPDSMLRLGQSLAALKEKEAACAALGELSRKYPRAAAGVKQGAERELKRNGC